ncbi:hypothetical protein L226DRAFT_232668 [Lentinus tigrinus ALCF2SS1-7]|uniref:uncharacterized protein n=1 Tax=Lentinus tigrinus ALCF2SS1-7 TaxID=1328758 RepID=UPI001166303C|nr:hypothetical protein L226DRAFT_232668 [Lentinus tigrinus ALCF2SS1-7]
MCSLTAPLSYLVLFVLRRRYTHLVRCGLRAWHSTREDGVQSDREYGKRRRRGLGLGSKHAPEGGCSRHAADVRCAAGLRACRFW